MHIIIIRTLNIPIIDYDRDDKMIFISGFRETILKGLKVLNSLSIFKSTPKLMSIIAVDTIKKSNFDQESFK